MEMRQVLYELNSLRESYSSSIQSAKIMFNINRMIKCVRRFDENDKCMYELGTTGFIKYLRRNLNRSPHLTTNVTIFKNPSLITSRTNLEMSSEFKLTDAVSIDLRKEFREQELELDSVLLDNEDQVEVNENSSFNFDGCLMS